MRKAPQQLANARACRSPSANHGRNRKATQPTGSDHSNPGQHRCGTQGKSAE